MQCIEKESIVKDGVVKKGVVMMYALDERVGCCPS